MKQKNIKNIYDLGRHILLTLALVILAGCAGGIVSHRFTFDVRDNPGIEVLDYRYGNSRQPGAHASDQDKATNSVRQSVSINGDMLVGDHLYVKWKIKDLGLVYEDTVDLKKLLPRDISQHGIYFIIKKDRLFVYLITPEKRPAEEKANGPRQTDYLKTITLSSNIGTKTTSQ